MTLTIDWI